MKKRYKSILQFKLKVQISKKVKYIKLGKNIHIKVTLRLHRVVGGYEQIQKKKKKCFFFLPGDVRLNMLKLFKWN